jgi:hypothetical protein
MELVRSPSYEVARLQNFIILSIYISKQLNVLEQSNGVLYLLHLNGAHEICVQICHKYVYKVTKVFMSVKI